MPIFDIELKPRLDLVARYTKPFPPFDPEAVKYGNAKDPEKKLAILKEKKEAHADEEAKYWANARDKSALNPLTSQIIAIGILDDKGPRILWGEERTILTEFWAVFNDYLGTAEPFTFWSGCGRATENFDADMIIRRSWILGVPVNPFAFSGRYLSNHFRDAAARYLLGKSEAYCSLTDAADQLGLYTADCGFYPKSDHDRVTGANFWQFWEGTPEDHQLAIKYLHNDLYTLDAIAKRIF